MRSNSPVGQLPQTSRKPYSTSARTVRRTFSGGTSVGTSKMRRRLAENSPVLLKAFSAVRGTCGLRGSSELFVVERHLQLSGRANIASYFEIALDRIFRGKYRGKI